LSLVSSFFLSLSDFKLAIDGVSTPNYSLSSHYKPFFVSEELESFESGSSTTYTLLSFHFLSFLSVIFPNLLSFLSLSSNSSFIFFYLSLAFPEVN